MNTLLGYKLCRKGLHQYPKTNKYCKECKKIACKKYEEENKTKRKSKAKEWYIKNKDKKLKRNKQWFEANQEKAKAYRQKWQKENKEKLAKLKRDWNLKNKEKRKEYKAKWKENNKNKTRLYKAKRRVLEKQAIPKWANMQKIEEIYKEAARLTKETGIKYHVDHIYPLQSHYLCGLHVETNLQIITEKENKIKANRFWPGQLECQTNKSYWTHLS